MAVRQRESKGLRTPSAGMNSCARSGTNCRRCRTLLWLPLELVDKTDRDFRVVLVGAKEVGSEQIGLHPIRQSPVARRKVDPTPGLESKRVLAAVGRHRHKVRSSGKGVRPDFDSPRTGKAESASSH